MSIDQEAMRKYNDSQFAAGVAMSREVDALNAQIERLRAVLDVTHKLVVDAALTGFNPHDGDWAERLFKNQGKIYDALKR